MLTINNQSDYALVLISYLTDKTDFVPLSLLVKTTGLPQRFLARIASELTHEGVLESREGKVGGYKLSKKFNDINLFQFLEIFEDELRFSKCADPEYKCRFEEVCRHNDFFRSKISSVLESTLTKIKVSAMFSKT